MRLCGTFQSLLKIVHHKFHPPLWRFQLFSHTKHKGRKNVATIRQEMHKPLLMHRTTIPYWSNILHVQFYSRGPSNRLNTSPPKEPQEDLQKSTKGQNKKCLLPVGVFAPKGEINDNKLIIIPLDVAHLDGAGLKKVMNSVNKLQLRGKQIEAIAEKEIKDINELTEDQNIFLKFEIITTDTTKKSTKQCCKAGTLPPVLETQSRPLPLDQSNDIIEIDSKSKAQVQELIIDMPQPMEDRLKDLAISSMQLTFDVDMGNICQAIANRDSDGKPNCDCDESRVLYQTKMDLNISEAPKDIVPLDFNAEMKGSVQINAEKLLSNAQLPNFNQNLTSIATYICNTALEESFSANAKDSLDINELNIDEFSSKLKESLKILKTSAQALNEQQEEQLRNDMNAISDKKDPHKKKYSTSIDRSHWAPNCRHMSTGRRLIQDYNINENMKSKRSSQTRCYSKKKGDKKDKKCKKLKKPTNSSLECMGLMKIAKDPCDKQKKKKKKCSRRHTSNYQELKAEVAKLYKGRIPCVKDEDDGCAEKLKEREEKEQECRKIWKKVAEGKEKRKNKKPLKVYGCVLPKPERNEMLEANIRRSPRLCLGQRGISNTATVRKRFISRTRIVNYPVGTCRKPKPVDDADGSKVMEVIRISQPYKIDRIECRRPIPKEFNVLIRTGSVAISGSDIHVYENGNRDVEGMTLGHDATGFIKEVGRCVHHLRVGDRVVMESALSCGICEFCKQGMYNMCRGLIFNGFLGTYQEHPADLCHRLPDNLSMEEGALTQTLALGCQACFKGSITPTSNVLIIGSCPTAISAALCAAAIGAKKVAIASSMGPALEMIKSDFGLPSVHFDSNALFGEVLEAIYKIFNEWPSCVINFAISAMTMNLAVMALQPCGVCVLAECESECASFNALDVLMKNIRLIPSFRSINMFPTALQLMKSGRAPMYKFIAKSYPWESLEDAFKCAQHEANIGLRKVIITSAEENKLGGKLFHRKHSCK